MLNSYSKHEIESFVGPTDIAQNSSHSLPAKHGQFHRDKVTVMQFIRIRRLFVF